jgi:purine-binding chemotaxis protein CheW
MKDDQMMSSLPQDATADDWQPIYQRLEAARAAIEQGLNPKLQGKNHMLRERAKVLARETQKWTTSEASLEVVVFQLAHESYAIETACIREVYPLKELTPLPCTPPFVLGIINIRGQILSVLDIKKFFQLPEQGLTDLKKVIILHSEEMEFGILVDAILGVRTIPLSKIQPSLPTLTDIGGEYLKGVTAERLIILDAARILTDKNIIVYEEIKG